jgi:molecular chaperone DnaK
MSAIVGIDLGTTNSLIGVMDAGFPILLADQEGERLTPSVVHFPANGEPLVGRTASRMRVVASESTVYSVKRFMGRRVGDAETAPDLILPYATTGQPGTPVRISVRGQEFSPEQISARILSKLKADAEAALDTEVTRAVITVPAYFNDAQRNATKAAGELAGLVVERIVNEPTAAALAYGLERLGEHSKIGVFDLGGGTFDISILELNAGVFQVLATNGNTRLGGDDIDEAIIHWLKGEILELMAGDAVSGEFTPGDLSRIREAAVFAKVRLSNNTEAEIDLPFLECGTSFTGVLTRRELEVLARPIIERTRAHCIRSLADAKLSAADLDEIILVGGQTRMPLVREFVEEVFGRAPNTSQNPDEAVALGATIQAGILSGAVRNVVLLDVTPLSLGIETFGGLMNVIIPRNSTIPTKAGEMFTNAVAGQQGMLIRVLQGEREMAKDNWELGQFEIAFLPAPKGQARVGVQFEIDANGILHVLARDTQTGAQRVVEMRSAVDVSDEAVEQMIAESLDHAFDDMSARVFTEARLKAEEMLPAVRNALSLVGSELDEAERQRIDQIIEQVNQALTTENPQALKRTTAALDEATQGLATLLVERAMEEALKRRGVI